MIKQVKRAALYVRVSTDHQTVENQIRELTQIAERRGWEVVEIYRDAGISGAKGRDGRPGLDAMLKDASWRKFDVVMAWAIDRLGRSLVDLLGTIQSGGNYIRPTHRGICERHAGAIARHELAVDDAGPHARQTRQGVSHPTHAARMGMAILGEAIYMNSI
jgi:hypothetical protein